MKCCESKKCNMITWAVLAALLAVAGARTKAPLIDESTRTRNKAAGRT